MSKDFTSTTVVIKSETQSSYCVAFRQTVADTIEPFFTDFQVGAVYSNIDNY